MVADGQQAWAMAGAGGPSRLRDGHVSGRSANQEALGQGMAASMRHHAWSFRLAAGLIALALSADAPVGATGCGREDFEAVVGEAATTLRGLAQRNTPAFQAKLRALRAKRGWSESELLREAAPLVQDDRIAELEAKAGALLAEIQSVGSERAGAGEADCATLEELRAKLAALVAVQTDKWRYMLDKVDGELAR